VSEFRARGYLPEALVNYLALIGWSPGEDDELLPIDELARRFSLGRVGHSAGVFDEEKLAWANRHYLKMADSLRIAALALPYFALAGVVMTPDRRGLEFLASAMAMATASVDRLDQVPARLAVVFDYRADSALADPLLREEMSGDAAQQVVRALAEELARSPRLDRERVRSVAGEVRSRTGQKGKPLFHPIRIALTAQTEGPELDLVIPAIDRGADLPRDAGVPPILGCRERAAAFVAALDRRR
jgi:glutamyl/glutaminyl-tRNA synthetase